MLSEQENERMSHVGPGTPMGNLLRRYWHPVATIHDLEREQVLARRGPARPGARPGEELPDAHVSW